MTFSRSTGLWLNTAGKMKRTELKRTRWPARNVPASSKAGSRREPASHKRQSRLRATVEPGQIASLAEWGRKVIDRDGNRCQWPACEFCWNREGSQVDPHHRALRSARPDLRLVLDCGITVCRLRHDWIHAGGRDEAIERGFLLLETYEAAAKNGTLGKVPL